MEKVNDVREYYQVFFWTIAGILVPISIALLYHLGLLLLI